MTAPLHEIPSKTLVSPLRCHHLYIRFSIISPELQWLLMLTKFYHLCIFKMLFIPLHFWSKILYCFLFYLLVFYENIEHSIILFHLYMSKTNKTWVPIISFPCIFLHINRSILTFLNLIIYLTMLPISFTYICINSLYKNSIIFYICIIPVLSNN